MLALWLVADSEAISYQVTHTLIKWENFEATLQRQLTIARLTFSLFFIN